MKFKECLLILFCIGIFLSSIALFKYVSLLNSQLYGSVPYNPKKINLRGEYQPHYGYTIVAMIDEELSEVAVQIENFIKGSSLRKSYSPLPANTYHMTIFSIYQCGSSLIPAVERWVNKSGASISKRNWLPDHVLEQQNAKAECVVKKYLNEPVFIKHASSNINERGIKLILQVEEESLLRIRNARKELARIYEHPDLSLEPINEKLHIGLAYAYAHMAKSYTDEWNQLNLLTSSFNGAKLLLPSVYLFDSMTHYIPFQTKTYFGCE